MFVSRSALAALLLSTGLGINAGTAMAEPSLCERASSAAPDKLQSELTGNEKLPEVFRDDNYVALQDKETWAMWTFTLPAHAAHPAVVCRRPVQEGETITLDMVINCQGEKTACNQLDVDFRALNARMAAEMNKKK